MYDESNSVSEYSESSDSRHNRLNATSCDLTESFNDSNFQFTDTSPVPGIEAQPFYVGREALSLMASEEFLVRYPIRYGDLNVSSKYNIHQCVEDLQQILETLFL